LNGMKKVTEATLNFTVGSTDSAHTTEASDLELETLNTELSHNDLRTGCKVILSLEVKS
jgi:hypothetical protein